MNAAGRGLLLVVDDDGATRTALSGFLRGLGYTTAEAGSGTDALRMVREGLKPVATISDAAVLIDDLPRPLLVLTASRSDRRGTADAILAKPFQLVDFGDRVLRLLLDHPRA